MNRKLILAMVILSHSIFSESAESLNKKALRLMLKNKLPEAETLLKKALELEPNSFRSSYNLASLIGLQLKSNYCEFQDKIPEAYKYLNISVQQNPAYKTKMLTDTDLDSFKGEFQFYSTAGFDPKKKKDLQFMLPKIKWYGPAAGIFGPENGLDFQTSGKVAFWYLDPKKLPDGEAKKLFIFGRYSFRGNKIILRFDKKIPSGRRDYYGEMQGNKLKFPGMKNEFSDDSDACSA